MWQASPSNGEACLTGCRAIEQQHGRRRRSSGRRRGTRVSAPPTLEGRGLRRAPYLCWVHTTPRTHQRHRAAADRCTSFRLNRSAAWAQRGDNLGLKGRFGPQCGRGQREMAENGDAYGSGDKYAGYATSIPMDDEEEEDEPRPGIGGPRCAARCQRKPLLRGCRKLRLRFVRSQRRHQARQGHGLGSMHTLHKPGRAAGRWVPAEATQRRREVARACGRVRAQRVLPRASRPRAPLCPHSPHNPRRAPRVHASPAPFAQRGAACGAQVQCGGPRGRGRGRGAQREGRRNALHPWWQQQVLAARGRRSLASLRACLRQPGGAPCARPRSHAARASLHRARRPAPASQKPSASLTARTSTAAAASTARCRPSATMRSSWATRRPTRACARTAT